MTRSRVAEHPVFGRERELEELESVWRVVESGNGRVVVIDGPDGIGKSALATAFVQSPRPGFVWTARGFQWESHIPLGVVAQLLGGEPPADIATALAALVGRIAELDTTNEPLVILVEDSHWADRESLEVLISACHRTAGRILVIFVLGGASVGGAATEPRRLLTSHSTDRILVGPLDRQGIRRLIAARTGLSPADAVIDQLVAFTVGITRQIVQILEEAPSSIWLRRAPAIPPPAAVLADVADRMARCTPNARALIQAAAVLGERCLLTQAARLAGITDPVGAFDEVHRLGIIEVDAEVGIQGMVFGSPAVRAAVYETLGPTRLQVLHRAAATTVSDEGARFAHRVAAASSTDDALADELDQFADRRATEGAWSAVADALITASRLSTERMVSERRLLRAVDALAAAGRIHDAAGWVSLIESFTPTPLRDSVLGYVALLRGRQADADLMLGRAWQQGAELTDRGIAALICQRRVLDSLARWRGQELIDWARKAMSLDAGAPAAVESEAIIGLGFAATGAVAAARSVYGGAGSARALGAQPQRFAMGKGWLDLAQDDLGNARQELESAVPTAFQDGSARISLWARVWLARTQFALGSWDDALAMADAAIAAVDVTGLEMLRPLAHWTAAQVRALRGDQLGAREHLTRGSSSSQDYAIMFIPSALARAHVAEAVADYPKVIGALHPLAVLESRHGPSEPGFWPWADIYANALVMVGRVDEASEFLDPYERLAQERGHASSLAKIGYVRGRIQGVRGELEHARATFDTALATLDLLPMPYDRARINFAYGQTLRRAGKRRDADAVLELARDAFASLGATSYVQRCDRELRAGGLNAVRSGRPQVDLTPQEQAVIELILSGASNREAANELYLSVKTVQYHLTRIYAKLGVRSRTELVARVRVLDLH